MLSNQADQQEHIRSPFWGIIYCASYLLGHTPLTKKIYGEKTIPQGRDKTAGTRAPP